MKSKDLQKVGISKYETGESLAKIHRDLSGVVSYRTIRRWCRQIATTGSINLSKPPGQIRTARTKGAIQKVKNRLKRKKSVSARKLALELEISERSVRRILKEDLNLKPYKKIVQPKLTDIHKAKRVQFANWIRNNFRKEDTMRILFSDEKMFDIDGIYNTQHDRVWAVDRATADANGGKIEKRQFPQKVMVWLGVCSKGVTPLVVFDEGSVDHDRYIREVLPVAADFGAKMFGDNWTFQQDGAKPHTRHLSQQWCRDNLPSFFDKDCWPANSPDLNPLDYSIWDEFARSIQWSRVTTKGTLVNELKRAVHKIRPEVVLESCTSWTCRLLRVSQNGGDYLSK